MNLVLFQEIENLGVYRLDQVGRQISVPLVYFFYDSRNKGFEWSTGIVFPLEVLNPYLDGCNIKRKLSWICGTFLKNIESKEIRISEQILMMEAGTCTFMFNSDREVNRKMIRKSLIHALRSFYLGANFRFYLLDIVPDCESNGLDDFSFYMMYNESGDETPRSFAVIVSNEYLNLFPMRGFSDKGIQFQFWITNQIIEVTRNFEVSHEKFALSCIGFQVYIISVPMGYDPMKLVDGLYRTWAY